MKIFLYDDSKTEVLNVKEIARYLEGKLARVKVRVRDGFIMRATREMGNASLTELAENFAGCRVYGPHQRNSSLQVLPAEVEYEKRRLQNRDSKSFGILYDGFKFQSLYQNLIKERERNIYFFPIIFTDQLFATWDEEDQRYHARVSVYGFPSIISTTGIVEAPAKPREFYLQKQWGMDAITLGEKFKNRFIDYDDPRLTEVMKGYCMQAIFFYLYGEPFCEDNRCRLYNAHWQEEVINAQLNEPEFCRRHEKLIDDIREGNLNISHLHGRN